MKLIVISLLSSLTIHAQVTIKGSDTLGAKMLPRLVEEYRKSHAATSFTIEAEGSNSVFISLLSGDTQIGLASRPVKITEKQAFEAKGLQLTEHIAAYNMLAVVVHEDNPVANLTLTQLERIFTGRLTDWETLGWTGKIRPWVRNTSSGTYKVFQKLAMANKPYGVQTSKLSGGMQITSEVAKDPQSICYCGLAYTRRTKVKPLSINGISPTAEHVSTYPLTQKLFYYTTQQLTEESKNFLTWALTSPEAASIITSVGFIPPSTSKKEFSR